MHIDNSVLGLGIDSRDSSGANHSYVPCHIYSARSRCLDDLHWIKIFPVMGRYK